MAALVGVEFGRKPFDGGDEDWGEEVEQEPLHGEHVLGNGDDEIRNHQNGRQSEAQDNGQGLDDANAPLRDECKGKQRHQQKGQGNCRRDDAKGEVHGSIVAG